MLRNPRYDASTKQIVVTAPCTRTDILHECDVVEDIAVAYGFNNIVERIPPTLHLGKEQPVMKLTELLRYEMCGAGYIELSCSASVPSVRLWVFEQEERWEHSGGHEQSHGREQRDCAPHASSGNLEDRGEQPGGESFQRAEAIRSVRRVPVGQHHGHWCEK